MRPGLAAVLGLALGAGLGAAVGCVNLPLLHRVSADPAWAQGVVIAREPGTHDSVTAEYVVGGVKRSVQSTFVGPPNAPKSSLTVGSPVLVAHARGAPDEALLEDPERAVRREFGIVLGVSLIAGAVFAYKAFRFARARASQSATPDVLKLSPP